jgi:ZIP family zinc transporter
MSKPSGTANWIAFLASVGAGLATCIGAAAAVQIGASRNPKFLAIGMSLAAGVMIYVSLAEIYHEGLDKLEEHFKNNLDEHLKDTKHHERPALAVNTAMFFIGALITWMLDFIVHRLYDSIGVHDSHGHMLPDAMAGKKLPEGDVENPKKLDPQVNRTLVTTGIITGIAMALHNFPEGLITFTSMVQSASSGIPLAIAIAVHNIPEGICIAIPVLYATGSKMKAFLWVCSCPLVHRMLLKSYRSTGSFANIVIPVTL